MATREPLIEAVRRFARQDGRTLRDLAAAIGAPVSSLSYFVRGMRALSAENLDKLGELLRLRVTQDPPDDPASGGRPIASRRRT